MQLLCTSISKLSDPDVQEVENTVYGHSALVLFQVTLNHKMFQSSTRHSTGGRLPS